MGLKRQVTWRRFKGQAVKRSREREREEVCPGRRGRKEQTKGAGKYDTRDCIYAYYERSNV